MKSPPGIRWNLLGSSLWLRPPEASDLPRVKAFLARQDLIRGGRAPAPADLPQRAGRRGSPGILLATDPLGAPAALFRFETAADEGTIGFVIPNDGLSQLREGLRLLAEGAGSRTRVHRLTIASVPADASLARALFEAGWDRKGTRWVHAIEREGSSAAAETSHAR
jgi:hypothetical protein